MQQPTMPACQVCNTAAPCECPSQTWPHAPVSRRGKLTRDDFSVTRQAPGCGGACDQGRKPCVCAAAMPPVHCRPRYSEPADLLGPPAHLPSRPFVWFAIGAGIVLGVLLGVHIILRAA